MIRPLFAEDRWEVPGLARWMAERLLRFVWHALTLAWWALAWSMFGDATTAVAATGLLSGIAILVTMRGHLAWPVLLAIGLLAGEGAGLVPDAGLGLLAAAGVAVAVVAAGFHVAWAFGGATDSLALAVPRGDDGGPAFEPGRSMTLAVAVALVGLAATIVLAATTDLVVVRVVAWASLAVLLVRAVGDGRQVGFSKTDRSTAFARADDRWWTPAVVLLGFGIGGALLAGA